MLGWHTFDDCVSVVYVVVEVVSMRCYVVVCFIDMYVCVVDVFLWMWVSAEHAFDEVR